MNATTNEISQGGTISELTISTETIATVLTKLSEDLPARTTPHKTASEAATSFKGNVDGLDTTSCTDCEGLDRNKERG